MEVQGATGSSTGGGSNEYGYNIDNIQAYLDRIHSTALQSAEEALRDTSSIESAADESWDGQARDNWKENLKTDVEHACDLLEGLYTHLCATVAETGNAMQEMDNNLIKTD